MKTNILKVFGFAALLGVAQGAFATVVTTEAELEAALAAGGTVTLGADIALTHEHQVGNTVVLDLGTHAITGADADNAFRVIGNGNLTVNAASENPGGIYVSETNCCVYTAYGLDQGRKTIVINGGIFSGNCLFNFSPDAAANVKYIYGLDVNGYGSGEKGDPTSVTINGGIFQDGYEDGNVGEYRCYYFTVNGGTFERGLDSADTIYGTIGATSTCKAFFKGGRYATRYPCKRPQDSQPKILIGDGYSDYVYYLEGDYYCIAQNHDNCAVSGTMCGDIVKQTGLFIYWVTGFHQQWDVESSPSRWYFATEDDAEYWGAENILPNTGDAEQNDIGGNEQNANVDETSPAPRAKLAAKSFNLLGTAQSNGNFPVTTGENAYDSFFVMTELPEGAEGWIDILKIKNFKDDTEIYERVRQASSKPSNPPLLSAIADKLDAAYIFDQGSEISAENPPMSSDYYANWNAKVIVSFDRPVAKKSVQLFLLGGAKAQGPRCANRYVPQLEQAGDDGRYSYVIGEADSTLGDITTKVWNGKLLYDSNLLWQSWGNNGGLPLLVAVQNMDEVANHGTKVRVEIRLTNKENPAQTVTRAYFEHKFGGDEPAPEPKIEEKAADVVEHDLDKVLHNEDPDFAVVDGNGEPIQMNVNDGWTEPTKIVKNTLNDVNGNSKNEEIKGTATGIGDVPTEAQEGATDFNKWLRRETVGIAIDTSAAVAKLDSISFEVEPLIETIVEDEEGNKTKTEPQKISNEEIKASGKNIKVILPLSDDFRVSAKVRHESEDQNYPTEEFICPVQGVAGGRYVEITTTHFSTFTLSPYNAVVTESDETLGIVKVAKTAGGETVAGVPFRKFDVTSGTAKAMTVDQLLVAGFGQDDDIYAYNPTKPSGDEYDMWAWDEGEWVGIAGQTQPSPAESAEIASGKAFWFKDESGSTTPLPLAGLYQENVTTTVDVGKKSLLVNPYPVAINAAEKLKEGACAGDQFALVGGSDRYEFRDGAWGVVAKGTVIKELPGGIKIYGSDTFTPATEIVIPAGQAFWYISTGATAPTVAW